MHGSCFFFLFPQPSFKQIWFINVHLGCQNYQKSVVYEFCHKKMVVFAPKPLSFNASGFATRPPKEREATVHRLGGSGSLFDRIYQHPHLRYLDPKKKKRWLKHVGVGWDFLWFFLGGAFFWEGFMNDLNDLCCFCFWGVGALCDFFF